MKYTFYNKSLDFAKDKYKVNSLQDLRNLDKMALNEIAGKVGAYQGMMPVENKENPLDERGFIWDKYLTIKNIENTTAINYYVSNMYWDDDIRKRLEEAKFITRLKDVNKGDDTFRLAQEFGIGFYDFKAFETRTLEVSQEWLESEFIRSGLAKNLVIKDENNVVVEYVVPIDSIIPQLNYNQASEVLNLFGVKKDPKWGLDIMQAEIAKIANTSMDNAEFQKFIRPILQSQLTWADLKRLAEEHNLKNPDNKIKYIGVPADEVKKQLGLKD